MQGDAYTLAPRSMDQRDPSTSFSLDFLPTGDTMPRAFPGSTLDPSVTTGASPGDPSAFCDIDPSRALYNSRDSSEDCFSGTTHSQTSAPFDPPTVSCLRPRTSRRALTAPPPRPRLSLPNKLSRQLSAELLRGLRPTTTTQQSTSSAWSERSGGDTPRPSSRPLKKRRHRGFPVTRNGARQRNYAQHRAPRRGTASPRRGNPPRRPRRLKPEQRITRSSSSTARG